MSHKIILSDTHLHAAIDSLVDTLEIWEQNITSLFKEWKLAQATKDDYAASQLNYKIQLQRFHALKTLDTFYTLAAYTITEESTGFGATESPKFYCRGLDDDQFFEMQRHIEGYIGAPEPLQPIDKTHTPAGHGIKPPKIEKILGDRYDKL